MKKIEILWHPYNKDKWIRIAKLERIDNNKYVFKYLGAETKYAEELGCHLPYLTSTYNETFITEHLPHFLKRRLPLYKEKFEGLDPLDILVETYGLTNSDNFACIEEKEKTR